MSVLLSGFLVLLSYYSSPFSRKLRALQKPSTTEPGCKHVISNRKQLWGFADYLAYKDIKCNGGKHVIQEPQDPNRGTVCLCTFKVFCADNSCICWKTN